MTHLHRTCLWLFEPLPEPRTANGVIVWWEKRRLIYNLFIGSIGFCSFLLFLFFILHTHVLKPGEDAEELLAIIFAPILVNICYTIGWIVEVLALRTGIGRRRLQGPLLLRAGFTFSLFVILLPTTLWGFTWIGMSLLHWR